jgi:hypothetical protein
VEVEREETHVPAVTVKAWVTHLRSHGWSDQDLDRNWLVRSRQGVTRRIATESSGRAA